MPNTTSTQTMLHTAILTVMIAALAAATPARSQQADSMRVNGRTRHYRLVMPEHGTAGMPLVVLLHGYGCGDISEPTCLDSIARKEGFALCVPQGLCDPTGHRSWNVGYPMQEGWRVDDVSDLCKMVAKLQSRHRLSTANVFLTGMSNGGEMCYLMMYRRQHTFKAIASIAGLTLCDTYKRLTPQQQLPFMEVHGTEDRTSEWDGDLTNAGGWGAYMPVPLAVGRIVANNRCTHESTVSLPTLHPGNGHKLTLHKFLGGDNGSDVWLYEVTGGDHCWHTGDMNTGRAIWEFFRQYIK